MSHLNEDDASYSPSKKKVWTFGGIVVMVIAIAVGKGLGRAGADYGIDTYQRHEAVAQVDTYMEKGDLAPFYHALQDVDPDRAAQFKAKIKSIIQEAPTRQNANEQMFYYARGALADYRKAALKASDESVREVAQSRLNLMRAVRADLGQAECARMAVSGPWPGMPNPPSVKRAVFDASTILVRAGAEGMRSPVTRGMPVFETVTPVSVDSP